jgi:mono/diheme cytochrome c family protein
MSTRKYFLRSALGFAITMTAAIPDAWADGSQTSPGLGYAVTEIDAAAVDLTVAADGEGLPRGSGTVTRGITVYAERCESCHGNAGAGGIGAIPRLTGGVGSLASATPLKTVNSYWPFAPVIFDYIRRAMPPTAPQSLSADDIYAVTAYLLSVDRVVDPGATLDAARLAKVQMPNREGFIPQWPTPKAPNARLSP